MSSLIGKNDDEPWSNLWVCPDCGQTELAVIAAAFPPYYIQKMRSPNGWVIFEPDMEDQAPLSAYVNVWQIMTNDVAHVFQCESPKQ